MRMIDSAAGDPHGASLSLRAGWEAGQPKPHTLRSATLTFSWSASEGRLWFPTLSPCTSHLPGGRPLVHGAESVAPGGTPGRGRPHPPHNKETGTKSRTKKAKTVPKTAGFCGLFGIVWWGMYRWGVVYICVWVVLWCVDTGLGRGSPWVPPLVEASLPCSRFVVCATAPAPLGFCAGGGGPSDG